jgi:hypothetical protein
LILEADTPELTSSQLCFSVINNMLRLALGTFTTLLGLAAGAAAAPGQPGTNSLTNRHWFEVRTANFHIYSCGPTEEVARVAMRLEQFREAYALLAGTQAVASPPIVVMAFPDQATMQPFLPLYQGKRHAPLATTGRSPPTSRITSTPAPSWPGGTTSKPATFATSMSRIVAAHRGATGAKTLLTG